MTPLRLSSPQTSATANAWDLRRLRLGRKQCKKGADSENSLADLSHGRRHKGSTYCRVLSASIREPEQSRRVQIREARERLTDALRGPSQ